MIDVAIIGAGGFGREVNLILQQLIKKQYHYRFLGYFDDEDKSEELDKLYLGTINHLNSYKEDISVVVAIGNGQVRKAVVDQIKNPKVSFLSLVSPYAIFNDLLEVGEGSIICAGANFTTNIKVGKFTVVNLNATIGHDCQLDDYSSVMPGANLSGDVHLKEEAFVGSGANILNGITLEQQSILGSGAVLTSDLSAGKTAVGVPAKEINS